MSSLEHGAGARGDRAGSLHAQAGGEIKVAAVRGAGFAFGGQWVRQGIGFGATVVLARLLTPADFGLVAMVTALTGMLEMYKDLGLSAATIQAPHLEDSQVNDLFWINTGLTVLIVAALVALAPVVANFYGRAELVAVTWALAIGFLAAGLSIQHWALMRRTMRFGILAVIETTGMVLAVSVAIGLAVAGMRYWALVGFILTPRLVNLIGAWSCCAWRPRFSFSGEGLRPLFGFGWKLAACNALTAFVAGMDSILIGRLAGGYPLGLYNRGLQVRAVFSGLMDIPLNSIGVSTLARLQSRPALFHDAYGRLLYLFQAALVPFWFVTLLCPEVLLRVIFGEQWVASAPFVRILGCLLLIQPLQTLLNTMFVALGRSGVMLAWGVVFSVLLGIGFWAGMLAGGVKGLAIGYVAAAAVSCLIGLFFAARAGGFQRPWPLVRPLLFPLISGLLSAMVTLWMWRVVWSLGGPFSGSARGWCLVLTACGVYGVIMLADLKRRNFMGLSWRMLMARPGSRGRPEADCHD
ncbi:MAG: lipopolysaccharide biosynthesis protein [Kiritimatiellia bacterium]